ncbi:PstS family phosphate ABC transporter substrate-binding protein [Virgibacillus flavescens]|uniref:PstS family phosphate ABC transporter substrate-binding protein n=1 Tax=Virgibacillus flavescens TaxID=1611422 RepID=UPI003D34FE4A
MKSRFTLLTVVMSLLVIFTAACGNGNGSGSGSASSGGDDSKKVMVDGSSTVFPIMEAVAEEYSAANPNVKATIGVSGTGGGFEKFIAGETDISNASRPIKEEEKQALKEAGIEYTEFKVALDGLSVVVNKKNDWVDQLTIEELNKMWSASSDVETWADVREGWPEEEIKFFSPGADSGTFDYFDEVVLDGEQIRKDASLSEDDNVLVQGVTGTKHAIGYFGYAYYLENKDELKVVPIVNKEGDAVKPSEETVQSGEYEPLSRPLYFYVKHKALEDETVYDFTKYSLKNAGEMAKAVGYVALPDNVYKEQLNKLDEIAGK